MVFLFEHAWLAFVKSLGLIVVSEIGDKTFFVTAVLAMRNSPSLVFAGSFGAMLFMTVLSAAIGWAAPALIPAAYTHYAAVALFTIFGIQTLYEAYKADWNEESELDQVERMMAEPKGGSKAGAEKSKARPGLIAKLLALFSPIFLKAFTLTFVAEWGDKSQITTIGLAASENVYGVCAGGVMGQAICSGIAVIGGKHLSGYINEKAMGFFGGLLFLAFAAHAAYHGP